LSHPNRPAPDRGPFEHVERREIPLGRDDVLPLPRQKVLLLWIRHDLASCRRCALNAASVDPVGFIRSLDAAVIDDIQRAPGLVLAIKTAVDVNPRCGRFLLTGFADLVTLPCVAESLAGRMAIVRLLPLPQAKLQGTPTSFLDKAFASEPPQSRVPIIGKDLLKMVLAGVYPEAVTRSG